MMRRDSPMGRAAQQGSMDATLREKDSLKLQKAPVPEVRDVTLRRDVPPPYAALQQNAS